MDYSQATKAILAKHLNVSVYDIEDTTYIDDIKPIDSIVFASIITELEMLVGKEIPVTEWITLSTVYDLVEIVERHVPH